MKLFAVVTLAAATLAAALPSSCGYEHRRPVSALQAFTDVPICWLVCFIEKPKCPDGLHPDKLGECWSCCRDEE